MADWVGRSAADIAAAVRAGEVTAGEVVAGHIGRFWDPRMRSRLVADVDAGADGLHPLVVAAVRLLR